MASRATPVQLRLISSLRVPGWPWPVRYSLAVGFAASAIALRTLLTVLWGYDLPFLTFFPAIVLSAWTGGFGPGVLATGLCGVAAQYFWLAPPESFRILYHRGAGALLLFVTIGAFLRVVPRMMHLGLRPLTLPLPHVP